MQLELEHYGKDITTVFQLLGEKEDDITSSLAWVFKNCPLLTKRFIESVISDSVSSEYLLIRNQHSATNEGRTDIEILDREETFHIIIEAKRGWILPSFAQLELYSLRSDFVASKAIHKHIVTLSECSQDYYKHNAPCAVVNGISVSHYSYKQINNLCHETHGEVGNSQKRLLLQFQEYLEQIMSMQNKDSNWVYVVALSWDKACNTSLSWIDIVEKKHRYFHPMGGDKSGWPVEPPNYLGFRYDGQLQSIHHVEDYVVTKNLHDQIPELPDKEEDKPYFVYTLGEPIRPSKVVKTGKIYASGRVRAMIDTLLTSDTIAEARDISKER